MGQTPPHRPHLGEDKQELGKSERSKSESPYISVEGAEEAKETLPNWNWGNPGVDERACVHGASVVLDEMVKAEVLYEPPMLEAGVSPVITFWPLGGDWPEVSIKLGPAFDYFIEHGFENYEAEEVRAFAAYLRSVSERIDGALKRRGR